MNKAKPNQSVHPKEAILFFGTPLFAVPALKKLIDNKYNLAGVVTAPAKPIGRHHNPVKSPIQVVAQENNIPCQTPDNLKDPAFLDWVLRQKPRVAIIAAYGKILPKKLLQIPSLGFVNIHPSLLPRHRGPTPIVHTILAGDKKWE